MAEHTPRVPELTCRREFAGGRHCGEPARYIVWGKLNDPEKLGPRCVGCLIDQHPQLRLSNLDQYAIYEIPDLPAIHAERDRAWREALKALPRYGDGIHHQDANLIELSAALDSLPSEGEAGECERCGGSTLVELRNESGSGTGWYPCPGCTGKNPQPEAEEAVSLPHLISGEFGVSTSEARRLLHQGGVRIDGKVWRALDAPMSHLAGKELQIGKRRKTRLAQQPDQDRSPGEGELQAAIEEAKALDAEGKLEAVRLESPPENLLRVVWREPGGERRRCSTYIPIPESVSDDFRAALAAGPPRFTAYTYDALHGPPKQRRIPRKEYVISPTESDGDREGADRG